ncbi:dual oxidase 2-like [Chrysoperla carnea]|uniref:dual oxidase 2-like n=1 Tax=Chrysoperla carnea TaxID=189513 RepID=UPI001D08E797|nr:dual oxidase 2-like [Chrysoperla carnea]
MCCYISKSQTIRNADGTRISTEPKKGQTVVNTQGLKVPTIDGIPKPDPEHIKDYLCDWLLFGRRIGTERGDEPTYQIAQEYPGYDGWFNNPSKPDLGAVDTPLLRRVPANYEDGVYQPAGQNRPNPLILSQVFLKSDGKRTYSNTGKNALLVFFGQQIVEEILDAQRPACPPEYFNIPIPDIHPFRNLTIHTEMPVLRTRYDQRSGRSSNNPRQQLNEITPYIDGGLIYGTSKAWSNHLRLYTNGTLAKNGMLASNDGGLWPEKNTMGLPMANPPPPTHHGKFTKDHKLFNVTRFFKLGNPRGNENPYLLTFGVIWFRWHNFLAKCLTKRNPDWSDERIFNEARKWTIASQQQIIFYEWLPEFLHDSLSESTYKAYNPTIDPQIEQLFQSAAFPFGHTLVPSAVKLRDYRSKGCSNMEYKIRTCNNYWTPNEAITYDYNGDKVMDIDRLILGMTYQPSEKEDSEIVEDLRGNVFGPLEFSRRDLMALNIQRGRDHGLPSYEDALKAYNVECKFCDKFKKTYKEKLDTIKTSNDNWSNDDIDVWVGGILETRSFGPGPLFKAIILDQFTRIRDGDRFWFENKYNMLFTENDIQRIKKLTFYDILLAVTNLEHYDLPKRVFGLAITEDEKKSLYGGLADNSEGCTKYHSPHHNCSLSEDFNSFLKNKYHITANKSCSYLYEEIWSDVAQLDACTPVGPQTYDYFSNSQLSFIMTFVILILFIVGVFGLIGFLVCSERKQRIDITKNRQKEHLKKLHTNSSTHMPFPALEWIDYKKPYRNVIVIVDIKCGEINLQSPTESKTVLRCINLKNKTQTLDLYLISDGLHLGVRFQHEYDLLLKFDQFFRQPFIDHLQSFISKLGLTRSGHNTKVPLKSFLKTITTKRQRDQQLQQFFQHAALSSEFGDRAKVQTKKDKEIKKKVHSTQLTLNEFADQLTIGVESEFAIKMFGLVDKDKNGFICFREFMAMLKILSNDKPIKMDDSETMSKVQFINMFRTLSELVYAKINNEELEKTIDDMMLEAGIDQNNSITFDDFKKLLTEYKDVLDFSKLDLSIKDVPFNSRLSEIKETFETLYATKEEIQRRIGGEQVLIQEQDELETKKITKESIQLNLFNKMLYWLTVRSTQIFWFTIFTFLLWLIFIERFYRYYFEREHSGLRRIVGSGVAFTRGAASAQMFCFATLLLTMCRHSITALRDTRLCHYIPLDSNLQMHIYIAWWALFFTVIHCVGHGFNFYHISTQTADDLTCLFRNVYHASHEIPKFHYWMWQTIPGVTGILLICMTTVMYSFTIPVVRQRLYNYFWFTHQQYPIFFILLYLHGSSRLIQEPLFWYFLFVPSLIFIIDHGYGISHKKMEISIVEAEILSSEVTMLKFKKPNGFSYKSGQWIRIACLEHNPNEYHAFTLTSCPQEQYLTVHIRALGPWTRRIKHVYNRAKPYPKIYLDGPFGAGHQNWDQFNVSVLIGGGIGVTPFASILKDIVYKNYGHNTDRNINKVYFIWTTRTQKQFEWMVDMIRYIESKDLDHLISIHIYITQIHEKYDLRTILLYLCERQFQKTSQRSLFTGLKAVTHFGRPDFHQFFDSIHTLHPNCQKIGVFTCGPAPFTKSAEDACAKMNTKTDEGPMFVHHYHNY